MEQNEETKTAILAGIRDNLLKPMAEEICTRNSDAVRGLRSLLIIITVLLALNLMVLVFLLLKLLSR